MDLMQSRLSLLRFETTAMPMSYSNTSNKRSQSLCTICKWSHKINFDQWFEQTTRNKISAVSLARISLATNYLSSSLHSIHLRLAGLCKVETRAIANVGLCCVVCLIKIFSSCSLNRWGVLVLDALVCDDLSANKATRRLENGGNAFNLRQVIYFWIFQLIFHLFLISISTCVCSRLSRILLHVQNNVQSRWTRAVVVCRMI